MNPTRADEVQMLQECLEAIRDYKPMEVAKDEFAYDRMVESYRQAARAGLEKQERMRLMRKRVVDGLGRAGEGA